MSPTSIVASSELASARPRVVQVIRAYPNHGTWRKKGLPSGKGTQHIAPLAPAGIVTDDCMNDRIVIGIPGEWPSRSDLVKSIASQSSGYLFAGVVLMELATSKTCKLEVYEHDAGLHRAFEIAGGDRISPHLLARIASHTFTAYLTGSELSHAGVAQMRRFAAAVLRSGGIAVKVDSTGIAHPSEAWLQDIEDDSISTLYPLFHTYVGSSEHFYSCGMKNFGLPDCSVDSSVSASIAAQTMHVFNQYQLSEAPALEDGHTFSIAAGAPTFRVSRQPYGYEPDDPLDNPFGRWHLRPAV